MGGGEKGAHVENTGVSNRERVLETMERTRLLLISHMICFLFVSFFFLLSLRTFQPLAPRVLSVSSRSYSINLSTERTLVSVRLTGAAATTFGPTTRAAIADVRRTEEKGSCGAAPTGG